MAQTKIPALGTCTFCSVELDKSKMTVHLKGCKARKAAIKAKEQNLRSEEEKTPLLTVLVEGKYNPEYWMYLEFPALMYLGEVDDFLRDTWLECCDHLSSFQVDRTYYSSELEDNPDHPDDSDEPDPAEEALEQEAKREMQEVVDEGLASGRISTERAEAIMNFYNTSTQRMTREYSMFVSSGKIFKPKQKVSYTYDFGSSTDLNMRLIASREGVFLDEEDDIEVLARNVAPTFTCSDCEQLANSISMWGGETYCNTCLKKHSDLEGTILPIVNSPRVGVCGYTGGSDVSWPYEDEDEFVRVRGDVDEDSSNAGTSGNDGEQEGKVKKLRNI